MGKAEAYAKELKQWAERLHNLEVSVDRLSERLKSSKEKLERLELQRRNLRPAETGKAAVLDKTISILRQQQASIATSFGEVVNKEENALRKLEIALYNFKSYHQQRLRR